jgi:hypothetical protein
MKKNIEILGMQCNFEKFIDYKKVITLQIENQINVCIFFAFMH